MTGRVYEQDAFDLLHGGTQKKARNDVKMILRCADELAR
jgi:hypothetical protein